MYNQGICYFRYIVIIENMAHQKETYTYQTDYVCYQPVEYYRIQFSDNV